jgi:hypothetical protein
MNKENKKLNEVENLVDVISSRYIEKVERKEMLDLWYMATKGKQVILCVGNDCI